MITTNAAELKETLYQYLAEGWHLFPLCWFDDQKQCACGYRDKITGKPHLENNIGKSPFLSGGFKNSTTTHAGVDEFMRLYPNCNWGDGSPAC